MEQQDFESKKTEQTKPDVILNSSADLQEISKYLANEIRHYTYYTDEHYSFIKVFRDYSQRKKTPFHDKETTMEFIYEELASNYYFNSKKQHQYDNNNVDVIKKDAARLGNFLNMIFNITANLEDHKTSNTFYLMCRSALYKDQLKAVIKKSQDDYKRDNPGPSRLDQKYIDMTEALGPNAADLQFLDDIQYYEEKVNDPQNTQKYFVDHARTYIKTNIDKMLVASGVPPKQQIVNIKYQESLLRIAMEEEVNNKIPNKEKIKILLYFVKQLRTVEELGNSDLRVIKQKYQQILQNINQEFLKLSKHKQVNQSLYLLRRSIISDIFIRDNCDLEVVLSERLHVLDIMTQVFPTDLGLEKSDPKSLDTPQDLNTKDIKEIFDYLDGQNKSIPNGAIDQYKIMALKRLLKYNIGNYTYFTENAPFLKKTLELLIATYQNQIKLPDGITCKVETLGRVYDLELGKGANAFIEKKKTNLSDLEKMINPDLLKNVNAQDMQEFYPKDQKIFDKKWTKKVEEPYFKQYPSGYEITASNNL